MEHLMVTQVFSTVLTSPWDSSMFHDILDRVDPMSHDGNLVLGDIKPSLNFKFMQLALRIAIWARSVLAGTATPKLSVHTQLARATDRTFAEHACVHNGHSFLVRVWSMKIGLEYQFTHSVEGANTDPCVFQSWSPLSTLLRRFVLKYCVVCNQFLKVRRIRRTKMKKGQERALIPWKRVFVEISI